MAKLFLILGDQLSRSISSLEEHTKDDVVLMAEVRSEATYVKHHKQKIAFLFSAMRHFAESLKEDGIKIRYSKYQDTNNTHSLFGEVERICQEIKPDCVVVTAPGEWRLQKEMECWEEKLGIPVEIPDDNRFICSLEEFEEWANDRKALRMEYFYREMRKKTGLLMEDDDPAGGDWNYDSQNRKKLPKAYDPPKRRELKIDQITQDVLSFVEKEFSDHFGSLDHFSYAVTRDEALRELDWFIDNALADFGDYQDAMATGQDFINHSKLSSYLNAGLLLPLEVCEAAEEAWRNQEAPLNAVEGFIRQIIGWREYVRGLYWLKMPEYKELNYFNAARKLPSFYWTGDTEMSCVAEAIRNTNDHAYAHHIQRLMITGNFALLADIDPTAINEWYLLVYADAYEWVELPNTHGMAIFADGGIMASKPYAASGSYINRMSDYCKNCKYNVKQRTGEGACPFNFLYWDFIARHKPKLNSNHRMGLVYKNLEKIDANDLKAMQSQAKEFLDSLD